jgi:hypothetical protein
MATATDHAATRQGSRDAATVRACGRRTVVEWAVDGLT